MCPTPNASVPAGSRSSRNRAACFGFQQHLQVLPGLDRSRLNPQRRSHLLNHLVHPPLKTQRDRQIAMRLAVLGVDFYGPTKMADRLVEPVSRTDENRQVEMGIGVLGVDQDGPAELGD